MGVTDIQVFGSVESGLTELKVRPDLVVLDFSLPGMNGRHFYQTIMIQ